jgi:hypothetical protein
MAVAAALLMAGAASAQDQEPAREPAPPKAESSGPGAADTAKEIVTQPARDVGLARREIPPLLVKASADPYSLDGLSSCRQLADAVRELNTVLGPDYDAARVQESRTATMAKAGGDAAISMVVPFRGLVREVSGAAPAERSYNAALDAGLARRGFLRGVHYKQGCRTSF